MPSGAKTPTVLQAPSTAGITTGYGYQAQLVVDRQSVAMSAAASNGTATVTLPSNPGSGYGFLIERVMVKSSSAQATTARVYVGSAVDPNEMDFTPNGNEDVADENSPIYVPAGATLTIVWTGASAGAVCTARVQYAVIRFVPASYGGGGG